MIKIFEVINNFIDYVDRHILLVLGVVFIKPAKRLLDWVGVTLLEGAITKAIEKLLPSIQEFINAIFNKIFDEKIKPIRQESSDRFDHLEEKFEAMKEKMEERFGAYKARKHQIEGELAEAKEAILNKDKDPERLAIVYETLKKQQEQKQL